MNSSRLRAVLQTCCVVISMLACAPSHAQLAPLEIPTERGDEPEKYRAVIDLALAEYRLGNFAEARAQFEYAHKLYPNARSFRALGMVEFELRNYGDAIANLEMALASPLKPLEGKRRDDAVKLLSRARGYVARLNLQIDPDAASVVVDGVPVKIGSTGSLVLEVGDHILEFRAPGRIAQKRPVRIASGEEQSLRVVLHEDAGLPRSRSAPMPCCPSPSGFMSPRAATSGSCWWRAASTRRAKSSWSTRSSRTSPRGRPASCRSS